MKCLRRILNVTRRDTIRTDTTRGGKSLSNTVTTIHPETRSQMGWSRYTTTARQHSIENIPTKNCRKGGKRPPTKETDKGNHRNSII